MSKSRGSRSQDDAGCLQHQCHAMGCQEQRGYSQCQVKLCGESWYFPKWELNALLCCRHSKGLKHSKGLSEMSSEAIPCGVIQAARRGVNRLTEEKGFRKDGSLRKPWRQQDSLAAGEWVQENVLQGKKLLLAAQLSSFAHHPLKNLVLPSTHRQLRACQVM